MHHHEDRHQFEESTDQYRLKVQYLYKTSVIKIELLYRNEELYRLYKLGFNEIYLKNLDTGVFNDLQIVYDCLKEGESRVVRPEEGKIILQGKLMIGKKIVIKEMILQLNLQKLHQNQALTMMVKDLQGQVKELKKKLENPHHHIQISDGDAQQQKKKANQQKKEQNIVFPQRGAFEQDDDHDQNQRVECKNQ